MELDPRITFFPKRKVRVELSGWAPKMNSQDEKRLRLDFMLPLVDEARGGVLPAWLLAPLNSMETEGSVESKTKLEVSLDGVTLEFWDTPKSPARNQLLTAATLGDFYLSRVKRDGSSFLALEFNTNVKRTQDLLKWCDRYEACFLWCEYTPASPEVPSKPVPGAQMTIADAAKDEPKEQSGEEAASNLKHFKAGGRDKEQVSKAIKESSELNQAHVAKSAKAKDESARRPRGF